MPALARCAAIREPMVPAPSTAARRTSNGCAASLERKLSPVANVLMLWLSPRKCISMQQRMRLNRSRAYGRALCRVKALAPSSPAILPRSGVQLFRASRSSLIQHVPPQRMSFWQQRMVKVLSCIVRHSELLHHPRRPQIGRNRKRNQRRQLHDLKRVAAPTARAPSVASPLPQYSGASRQPISTHGVNAASNRGITQPDISDEFRALSRSSAAQGPNPCCSRCASARSTIASLSSRERGAGQELHHRRDRGSSAQTARDPLSSHRRRISRSVSRIASAGRIISPAA